MSAFDDLREHWADPPAIYRGAPFWSWNSELDPDRLCRQIESMHGAGLGGFFMHSRYGLKTAYLSDEWFECVGACVEKARELNIAGRVKQEFGSAPHLILGGFHLSHTPAAGVEQVIDDLKQLGVTKVGPAHCTGDGAIALFAERWGKGFVRIGCGWSAETELR